MLKRGLTVLLAILCFVTLAAFSAPPQDELAEYCHAIDCYDISGISFGVSGMSLGGSSGAMIERTQVYCNFSHE